MPIIIKEIHVKTVVEKKVVLPEEISPQTVRTIKEQVMEELSEDRRQAEQTRNLKRER